MEFMHHMGRAFGVLIVLTVRLGVLGHGVIWCGQRRGWFRPPAPHLGLPQSSPSQPGTDGGGGGGDTSGLVGIAAAAVTSPAPPVSSVRCRCCTAWVAVSRLLFGWQVPQ